MAATYTLISKNVLTSSNTSITLTSIPATYTHLKIIATTRSSDGTYVDAAALLTNGSSSSYVTNYMDSNATGTPRSGSSASYQTLFAPSTYAASLFSYIEILIPNYTGSNEKNIAVFQNIENTVADAYCGSTRTYTANSSAITSLTLIMPGSWSYATGSAIYLYGLANS